ncbi:MAG: dephospho-CoA kinase [Bacteroidales bacterium]
MLKIGLTGGIGSGKTYVSEIFQSLGVAVYAADTEAKRLMESDPAIIDALNKHFGQEVYLEGKLNRSYLGEVVFKDQQALELLNSIVHPVVHNDFERWSADFKEDPYVIEEAAILFESGGAEKMDYTLFVKADLKTRIDRVMKRDGVSEEKVMERINNQMDVLKKEKLADFIIYNENDSMILPQIVDLHMNFLKIK